VSLPARRYVTGKSSTQPLRSSFFSQRASIRFPSSLIVANMRCENVG
jgi:hypothetical protein